ncbi:MAG: DUF4421 domain-containing protein [Bacteroidales bacterium]|nr:DUF4421 domain-containing protein [Bacteroidales bacterium]
MKRLFFLIIITTGFSVFVNASSVLMPDSLHLIDIKKKDSVNLSYNNIVDYSDKLALFLYAKQKFSQFGIYNKSLNKKIEYSPNDRLNMGFGFNYKWLGIGLAFNFSFVNNDNDKYGETKRLDCQTNIYLEKLVIDFYLQYYKGYYVQNPQEVFPEWKNGDIMYIRPDISSTTLGLGALYVFNNKNFSYKSAFLHTAIQKQSAGSFLLGGHILFQEINADSTILPSNTIFEDQPLPVTHNALYLGVITAYAYNFVIRKDYFASLSLSANLQLGSVSTIMEDGNIYDGFVPVFHLQPRISVGINKPKWYTGVSYVNNLITELYNEENQEWALSFSYGNYRIFIGYRFDWFSKKQ